MEYIMIVGESTRNVFGQALLDLVAESLNKRIVCANHIEEAKTLLKKEKGLFLLITEVILPPNQKAYEEIKKIESLISTGEQELLQLRASHNQPRIQRMVRDMLTRKQYEWEGENETIEDKEQQLHQHQLYGLINDSFDVQGGVNLIQWLKSEIFGLAPAQKLPGPIWFLTARSEATLKKRGLSLAEKCLWSPPPPPFLYPMALINGLRYLIGLDETPGPTVDPDSHPNSFLAESFLITSVLCDYTHKKV